MLLWLICGDILAVADADGADMADADVADVMPVPWTLRSARDSFFALVAPPLSSSQT
jgi:hypothetical protein